jgi:hypothetical protein
MGIKSKRINILAVYEESFKDPHRYDKLKIILPIVGIVIVIMIASGLSFYARMVSQSDLNDVNWKVVKTKAALSVADKDSYDEMKALIKENSEISDFNKSLDKYVPYTYDVGKDLYIRAEKTKCLITTIAYSKDDNTVRLIGNGDTALQLHDFVDSIMKNEKYEKVTYTGYTSSLQSSESDTTQNTTQNTADNTSTSSYAYNYTITFHLKGGM